MLTETQRADFMNELAWTRVQIHDLVELEQLLLGQVVLDETKLQSAQHELAKQILVREELSAVESGWWMPRVQKEFTWAGTPRRPWRCIRAALFRVDGWSQTLAAGQLSLHESPAKGYEQDSKRRKSHGRIP
jgi:hypothetical protein